MRRDPQACATVLRAHPKPRAIVHPAAADTPRHLPSGGPLR
jgi:hypothetical protein